MMQFSILPEEIKNLVETIEILRLKCLLPPSVIFTVLKYIDFNFS
jgi:hypothetical protein